METKILPTHRIIWTLIGIYPIDENESKWKKWTVKLFPLFSIVSHSSLLAATIAYIIEFIWIDLEHSLHAFGQLACFFPWMFVLPIGLIHRHKMVFVFDKLAEIHAKYKNMESYDYLMRANETSEWLWQFYFKFMLCSFLSTVVFTTSSIYMSWLFHGHFDAKYLYHPFKVILPWNCKTPIGYIGEIGFHVVTGQTFLFCVGVVLLLFIAKCLHHQAFYQMFCHSLRKFEGLSTKQNHKEHLCELIRFHVSVKGWMLISVEAYSLFLLVQLIFLTVGIGIIFFMIDMQVQHFDFDILIVVLGFFTSTSNPFAYCLFGKITTECYGNMADRVFEINWQKLPNEIQKYFILMIENMQRPLYYHGFEFIILNLETFQQIFRKTVTFYMMFKTLTTT